MSDATPTRCYHPGCPFPGAVRVIEPGGSAMLCDLHAALVVSQRVPGHRVVVFLEPVGAAVR